MLLNTILNQAIWFAGDFSRHFFINMPLRPGLFLSCISEFLERSVKNLCQHIFHQITTPPVASPRHPRPKYLIRDYTPGLKLKITEFQSGHVWYLYVWLNNNFDTYVDTNSNDSGTKFKHSWVHICNNCWKMLLNKKQSEFVQQHLHVKRCWTKSPQQRINRTVSTQRHTRVCWLVLEPSNGAVGLSTLRNMLKNHPLNCVILPIFLLVSKKDCHQNWTQQRKTQTNMIRLRRKERKVGYTGFEFVIWAETRVLLLCIITNKYGAILKMIFQGRYALPKGHVSRLRCSFEVNL